MNRPNISDGSFVYPSRIDWANRITFTTNADWVATQRVWVELLVIGAGSYQLYIDGVECSTYDETNGLGYRSFSGIVEKGQTIRSNRFIYQALKIYPMIF